MDIRAATKLCIDDLIPLIEAGDFRQIGAAEKLVEAAVASIPSEQYRSMMLYQLGTELQLIEVAGRPECDAYLRAIRAIARRNLRLSFNPLSYSNHAGKALSFGGGKEAS